MTEQYTGCKEMSVDDFLKLIDNSPELKEKFEQLGISQDEEGFKILLNYYDLLTKEELEFLKKDFKQFYPGNSKEKDTGWYVKFGAKPASRYLCFSNVICDSCYKSLLEVRKYKDHLKHRFLNE